MPMSDEVAEQIPHLKPGSPYLFDHIRKGPFVGEFIGIKTIADANDALDTFFLEVDAYTEDGSGQERLANSFTRDSMGRKMRPPISKKFIRPSLLKSITRPAGELHRVAVQQFTRIRAEAEAKADGQEPMIPLLSLPTAAAMNRLNSQPESRVRPTQSAAEATPENVGRKSWWKRIVGR